MVREEQGVLFAPAGLDRIGSKKSIRSKALHPELFNVTLIQADGDVLLTAKNPPGTMRVSLAKETSFLNFIEELKQGNHSGIGQPLLDLVSKAVIVPVRYAINDRQGNLHYVVSANFLHEHLRSFWMDAPSRERRRSGSYVTTVSC